MEANVEIDGGDAKLAAIEEVVIVNDDDDDVLYEGGLVTM